MGPRVSSAALAERLESVIGPRASVARGVLDQHGQSESYYRALSPALDPEGLMNPGKIFAGAQP